MSPPSWLGGFATVGGSTSPTPTLPGGYSLLLSADTGLTVVGGAATWHDQGPHSLVFTNGSGASMGTINGNAALALSASPMTTLAGTPISTIILNSAYTVGAVFQYDGSHQQASLTASSPELISDAPGFQYWGVTTALNSTDPTKVMAGHYIYGGAHGYYYNQQTGAPGSASAPHYLVASFDAGAGHSQVSLDGVAATLVTSGGPIDDVTSAIYLGGQNSIIRLQFLVVYPSVLAPSGLEAYLASIGGF